MDLQETLRRLLAGHTTTEDRTVFVRETPQGEKTDFEIVERTRFRGYPETTKEYRTKRALPCGHQIDKTNPFGGYCNGRRLFRGKCNAEYCSKCSVQCAHCGKSVSVACHAAPLAGELLCKSCCRKLKRKARFGALVALLMAPFIEDEDAGQTKDDWRAEAIARERAWRREQERLRSGSMDEHSHGDD